jgi:hypothetical protein
MRSISRPIALAVLVFLTGCSANLAVQISSSSPDESPTPSFELIRTPQAPVKNALLLISSGLSHDTVAGQIESSSPAVNQFSEESHRLPYESATIVQKTSQFGAPYDEEYSFQIDTAVWQPELLYEENDWVVHEISTTKVPICTIQVKVMKDGAFDAAAIRLIDNRYRRMGTFITSALTFDIFSFTSNTENLADTQNVIYILTGANGDEPYLMKPQYRAFSSYQDWDACRSLVRASLSSLVMTRIPPK